MKKVVAVSALLGVALVGDITASLTPHTYAENLGYSCFSAEINQPTISNPCPNSTVDTAPIACFLESTAATLPITYASSSGFTPISTLPVPLFNGSFVTQDTTILSNPLTVFTLSNQLNDRLFQRSQSLTSVSNGANGTATANTPARFISYTPNSGYKGTDILIYTTTDSLGIVRTGKIALKIPLNNSTLESWARSVAGNVPWNSTQSIINTGIAISVATPTIVSNPTHGTLTLAPASGAFHRFYYTPDPGYLGEDTFTLTANAGSATSSLSQGIIQVYNPLTTIVAPYLEQMVYSSPYQFEVDIYNAAASMMNSNGNRAGSSFSFTTPPIASGSLVIPIKNTTAFGSGQYFGTERIHEKKSAIRVDHINTSPSISNLNTIVNGPNIDISFVGADSENNSGNITFELSKDNFDSSTSYNFALNTIAGPHNLTIENVANGVYQGRVVIQETNGLEACAGFVRGTNTPQISTPAANLRTTSPVSGFSLLTEQTTETEFTAESTPPTFTTSPESPSTTNLNPIVSDAGLIPPIISINTPTVVMSDFGKNKPTVLIRTGGI
jgi:hypothetical protein